MSLSNLAPPKEPGKSNLRGKMFSLFSHSSKKSEKEFSQKPVPIDNLPPLEKDQTISNTTSEETQRSVLEKTDEEIFDEEMKMSKLQEEIKAKSLKESLSEKARIENKLKLAEPNSKNTGIRFAGEEANHRKKHLEKPVINFSDESSDEGTVFVNEKKAKKSKWLIDDKPQSSTSNNSEFTKETS